jgi:NTE family protein
MTAMRALLPGRIGLALGSGAARGWAHIGVIRALESAGVVPEVVCGTSVGAVVGAAYASGHLDAFEGWVRGLERGRVLRNLDLSFRGGLFKGAQFFAFMSPELPDADIAALPRVFGAVATDLETGHEVWLREGSLHGALRASVALPGLITPAERDGRWLVDGGLVNPVPVSLCRALGAESVVAVDLNTTLLARRLLRSADSLEESADESATGGLEQLGGSADGVGHEDGAGGDGAGEAGRLRTAIEAWARELRERIGSSSEAREPVLPSLYEVLANSLNIMQVHITRSRMAGDPPDLLVAPRLADFALLDLDRGAEAIDEGRRAAERALATASEIAGQDS